MGKRLFIAIKTTPEIDKKILDWQNKFSSLPVRFLKGKNLHITLIPPWQENDLEDLKNRLHTLTGQVKPFLMKFHEITFGADFKNPNMIWATGQTPKEIIELKSLIEKTIDIEPENRAFRLHITLARFRAENFPYDLKFQIPTQINWQQQVKSIVIMESHLSASGAEYKILEEIPI